MTTQTQAFVAQAASDLDAYDVLARSTLPQSHRLHYLQMWLEKLCKAYLWLPDVATADERFSHKVVNKVLPRIRENLGMDALEMIFEDGKAEGKAEAEAVGEAKALLEVLRARGLAVEAAHEARIRETRDGALFDRWLELALVATSVDEVLAD